MITMYETTMSRAANARARDEPGFVKNAEVLAASRSAPRDRDTLHENVSRVQRSAETGGSRPDLCEAIDDGGNPNAPVNQQCVECSDPHDFAYEGRGPRLEIAFFEQHHRRAPSEFDNGKDSE